MKIDRTKWREAFACSIVDQDLVILGSGGVVAAADAMADRLGVVLVDQVDGEEAA